MVSERCRWVHSPASNSPKTSARSRRGRSGHQELPWQILRFEGPALARPAFGAVCRRDVEAGEQVADPLRDLVADRPHGCRGPVRRGRRAPSPRSACPGTNGQASPQPIVTTTSAARTISSVQGFGNSAGDVDADLGHRRDRRRVHLGRRARSRPTTRRRGRRRGARTIRAPSATGRRCARRGRARPAGDRRAVPAAMSSLMIELIRSAGCGSCGTTRSAAAIRGQEARQADRSDGAEHLRRRRTSGRCDGRDAGERVGQRPRDRDRRVREARRRREPVRRRDVAADRERGRRAARPARTTPRITSSSPNVATNSPSHKPRPDERVCVESVDRRQVEHQVGDDRADARADDLRDDVDAQRRAVVDPTEEPVGERDDRVEVRARDRAEREDQRDEPGAGRDRVLEQLQPDVARRQPLRGDARADDDRDEEARCRRLRRVARRASVAVHDRSAAARGRLGRGRAAHRVGVRARPCAARRPASRRRRAPCRSPTARRRARRPTPCPARA